MRKSSPCFYLCFAFLICWGLFAQESAYAAESSTILTGKVVATVVRGAVLPFNAVVDEVLVKPGDAVEEGSPLMRYHLQDEAERILQREITTGASTEGLKGQVLELKRVLADYTAQRNKTRQLVASGLGSKQALARLEENVESTKNRIELLRTTIQKQESIFKARLKELGGYYGQPISEGSELPGTLTLTSPIKGHALYIDSALHPGHLIGAGAAPISVGQLNPVLIQVPVYEAEINAIKVGDTAEVEIPSLHNKKFKGVVSKISWISTDMNVSNPSYYMVDLTVSNPDLLLKPGYKAVVRL